MTRPRFGAGLALVLLAVFACLPAAAEYQNAKFRYAITFPQGWRVNEDARNDAVTATRPDGNAQVAVQALDLQGKITSADQLADLFTARIFTSYRFGGKQPDNLGGVPGVAAVYTNVNKGKEAVIGAFYMVQAPYGFVLYAAMPANEAQVLSKQLDLVFKTFRRTTAGSAPQTATLAPQVAPAPIAPAAPAATAPSAAPQIEPIDAPYVTVSEARVRERPDVLAPTVETLKPGTRVHALGRVAGTQWILLSRNDAPLGYVVETQVADAAKAAPPARVASAPPAAAPAAAAPAVKVNVPAGVDFGRFYALVIGNTGYSAFPALKTAGADAEAIAALLRDSYGYKTQVIRDATRIAIIDAIEGYREKLGRNDNLLIFYAGHGWMDEKAGRGYWLPVDATPDSKANWISNTTITDSIKAMDAKHVMVVADSCFSGTLTRGIKIQRRDADYFKRLAEKKARVAMTSGGLEPVSDSGGQGHSAFAQAFLDALAKNDGVLDGSELFKRIERPVKLNADQTPAYADIRKAGHEEGGDFLFVRRR